MKKGLILFFILLLVAFGFSPSEAARDKDTLQSLANRLARMEILQGAAHIEIDPPEAGRFDPHAPLGQL